VDGSNAVNNELSPNDWQRWIGQVVRVRSTGQRGTVVGAAGNWNDSDDHGWLVVRTAGGQGNYHVDDLAMADPSSGQTPDAAGRR
jgi:hypothetical protein